jgi:hypothetical protein
MKVSDKYLTLSIVGFSPSYNTHVEVSGVPFPLGKIYLKKEHAKSLRDLLNQLPLDEND